MANYCSIQNVILLLNTNVVMDTAFYSNGFAMGMMIAKIEVMKKVVISHVTKGMCCE